MSIAIEKMNGQKMIVQLILASGSRAGTAAVINAGYYMIGRDGECQIRPKSRSISQHHCLMQYHLSTFRVFDLKSEAGTFVNEKQLIPHTWHELSDGDILRCGKIAFHVSVERSKAIVGTASETPSIPTDSSKDDAWHDFDVAGFLDEHDTTDRETRYEEIRSKMADDGFLDGSLEKETNSSIEESEPLASDSGVLDSQVEADRIASDRESSPKADRSTTPKAKPKKNRRSKIPKAKKKPKPSRERTGVSLSTLISIDRLKLAGAVVLAVAVLGLLCHSLYRFQVGTPARVIEQID